MFSPQSMYTCLATKLIFLQKKKKVMPSTIYSHPVQSNIVHINSLQHSTYITLKRTVHLMQYYEIRIHDATHITDTKKSVT